MRQLLSQLSILFLLLCLPTSGFCWDVGHWFEKEWLASGKAVDDACHEAKNDLEKNVRRLVGGAKNLGNAVLKMGDEDLQKLKNIYKGDVHNLWDDLKHDFSYAENELKAAERLGIDSFDLLTKEAREYLEKEWKALERKTILGWSTNKRDINVTSRIPKPATGIYLKSINKADITAVGGLTADVKVHFLGFGHTFKAGIGDSSSEINYGVVKVKNGTSLQNVAIDQTIEKGKHHYYGVSANIGSVIHDKRYDRDVYLNNY
jgi:hypothetical protein